MFIKNLKKKIIAFFCVKLALERKTVSSCSFLELFLLLLSLFEACSGLRQPGSPTEKSAGFSQEEGTNYLLLCFWTQNTIQERINTLSYKLESTSQLHWEERAYWSSTLSWRFDFRSEAKLQVTYGTWRPRKDFPRRQWAESPAGLWSVWEIAPLTRQQSASMCILLSYSFSTYMYTKPNDVWTVL